MFTFPESYRDSIDVMLGCTYSEKNLDTIRFAVELHGVSSYFTPAVLFSFILDEDKRRAMVKLMSSEVEATKLLLSFAKSLDRFNIEVADMIQARLAREFEENGREEK